MAGKMTVPKVARGVVKDTKFIMGELVDYEGTIYRVVHTITTSSGGGRTVKAYAEPDGKFEWIDERKLRSIRKGK